MRLRSGRCDWTVQVTYLPPLSESGARRRAQGESHKDDNGVPPKKSQKQSSEARRSWDWTLTQDWG